MKLVEIRDWAAATQLRPQWTELLGHSASASIFLTPEWTEAWWASYAAPSDQLLLIAAFDDSGTLHGLAPLRERAERRYGQTVRALSFAVDGSNDSEYLDFLIRHSPAGEEAARAIQTRLEQECAQGAVLLLNEVPAASPNIAWLKEVNAAVKTEKDISCAVAPLPASFEEYVRGLKPRFRTKVRSVLRNLEGRVSFHWCRTQEDVDRLLPRLYELHTRRWAVEGKPGVFGSASKRAFYAHLSRLLLAQGQLRVSWMEWNERVLAVQYGFVYNDTYLHLQEGYEPACEHWQVGVALRAWSVGELIGEGVTEYDFLGGVNRHKQDWGAVTKLSRNFQFAAANWKNRLFCCGPDWERRGRDSVPQSLLELRRALREKDHAGWARNAAARVYVNSGLGTLSAPLRSRFRLSTSPRVFLERRSGPTARILYYHRVNDNADPFFPSLGTAAFAAQMEYVARHYTVVSLSELVSRLRDGGSSEQIMAITFDDGYRDNFTNAFPILQRLGLTATIFLTTGALDRGEPMWFEQLAGAIKHTARDRIDMEIDLPRRLPLATTADRLAANDAIYGVLRQLPDGERVSWLCRILDELGAAPARSREDGMLGWDDVRRMGALGIGFGGHTVNHPFVSRLQPDEALWEASECKRRIEEELQQPVVHFAYPSGREQDVGPGNKELIRAAGYQAAVTTIWGVNDSATDLMELRRGQPWEETPELFACKLDWYQLVNG